MFQFEDFLDVVHSAFKRREYRGELTYRNKHDAK